MNNPIMTCSQCSNVLSIGQVTESYPGETTFKCNRCDCVTRITVSILQLGNPDKVKATREWLDRDNFEKRKEIE